MLAQSSGEGAAHADPGGVTSAPGAGTCDPERSPKDRQLSHPAQAMGKDPFPHPIPPSCESVGTAGDSVPGRDKSLSVAPAGTNGHSSSAGPAGTEGQGGSPGQPSQEKDLIQKPGDLHPTAFMGQEDWIKNTGYTVTECWNDCGTVRDLTSVCGSETGSGVCWVLPQGWDPARIPGG